MIWLKDRINIRREAMTVNNADNFNIAMSYSLEGRFCAFSNMVS